jgi:glycerol-3-phosphate dehydrogenase subunit B
MNGKPQAAGVTLDAAGRQSILDSRFTIIATGSFLHGGLIAAQNHRLYEPAFNLPVESSGNRSEWVSPSVFDNQPYAEFGVSVNSNMQPLDVRGELMFDNLYAIGGILKGADRTSEGSRQGIDIVTAYCAVEHILRRSS